MLVSYDQSRSIATNVHQHTVSFAKLIALGNDTLILNYVRVYENPTKPAPLSVLDCLGALSVAINLKPDLILVHTNNISVNPLALCDSLLNLSGIIWPPVQLNPVELHRNMSGKRITYIAHEADVRKLQAVEEYGGLVLDFDVYVTNGTLLRSLLKQYPCIVCHEVDRLNAGFLGCRKPHARYPQLILDEVYRKNYNPECWLCSSGTKPFNILKRNNGTAAMVDGVCDHDSGVVKVKNWETLPAFHSYWHQNPFTLKDTQKLNSTLGDIFRWLLKGAPRALAGHHMPLE